MEWLTKILDIVKIPLKVLLPAVWLFSGALMLLSDNVLEKLYLLEWKSEHGFALGLVFVISSCIIVVYVAYFLKSKIVKLYTAATLNRKTIDRIKKKSIPEQAILLKLYHSPALTCLLDYSQPVVQGLLSQKYIFAGGSQLVSYDAWSDTLPMKYTLQPYVYRALEWYKTELIKRISKLQSKIEKAKNPKKQKKLLTELENTQDMYNAYYDGGNYDE